MSYNGPSFDQLKTLARGIILRELHADAGVADDLLDLCVHGAIDDAEDYYDWETLQATVVTTDAGGPLVTTVGSRLVAKPARYKGGARLYYLAGNVRKPIALSVAGKPISMEWMRENHPDPTQQAAAPVAMCEWGENFLLVPTPSAALTLELDAALRTPDLVAGEGEGSRNWFTAHLGQAVLAMAVAGALEILGEQAAADRFRGLGQRQVAARADTEMTARVRRTPVQMGQEPT